MQKTKKKENKTLKKLEAELKGIEKSSKGYGGPKPREPMLNFNTNLLFAAQNWCIVLDNSGKAYGVHLSGIKDHKTLTIKAL